MKPTPTKLKDITLSQWVGYLNQFGIPENTGDETADFVYNLLNRWMYYTGNPQPSQDELVNVLKEQSIADALMKAEQLALNYNDTYIWNDAIWRIQPLINNTGKLTRAEFEITQDLALIYSDMQDGKNEALYHLCAAFFRQEGEPYTSELVDDDGDRIALIKTLPLNLALCVHDYTKDCIDIYLNSINT